ncbi:hypothetical protein GGR57DRAFT_323871 [Xylariaceae sp. FL1272]|nr:hypothetical protein GGR57DRAFT_323871 [Xylariaceae sp. FL1272]
MSLLFFIFFSRVHCFVADRIDSHTLLKCPIAYKLVLDRTIQVQLFVLTCSFSNKMLLDQPLATHTAKTSLPIHKMYGSIPQQFSSVPPYPLNSGCSVLASHDLETPLS